jgi:hypothetical protein
MVFAIGVAALYVMGMEGSVALTAGIIFALADLGALQHQTPALELPEEAPEGYRDEFAQDVAAQYLPVWGLLAGAGAAFALGLVSAIDGGEVGQLLAPVGAIVAGWGWRL